MSLSPLLTPKGVPERFCPTFGAFAVLRGRHLLSECLGEQRPSHFCPVQQGKYESKPLRRPRRTTESFLRAVSPCGATNQHVFPSSNDQESCVRVLLYRGANKEAKNKHGQTPFQVNTVCPRPVQSCSSLEHVAQQQCVCCSDGCLQLAIMSGHFELGEIIKNHKDSDVGKLYVYMFLYFF